MSKVNIKKIGGFKEEIEEVMEEPLDDAEIRFYLPDAKILKYSELAKYRNINELLPENTDYAIILYLDEENKGHWTAVLKYDNKNITKLWSWCRGDYDDNGHFEIKKLDE